MTPLSYSLPTPLRADPLRRVASALGTWLLAIAAMALVLSADWMLYTALESSLHLCFPQ